MTTSPPDDESLSAGGLLARHAAQGAPVKVVTATWAAGTERAVELAAALRHLGGTTVSTLSPIARRELLATAWYAVHDLVT